jgi:glutamyl-tRNA synthetase
MKEQHNTTQANKQVRTRFAPSPTGPLHIGGVRTALYNYLFAKNQGGKFLLRIEDTDQARYVPNTEQYIINSLKWLGIIIDEGYSIGGPHAPYKQSERTHIYKQYANYLIQNKKAYYAFDTEEELESMRTKLREAGIISPQYNASIRHKMTNSLTLPKEETEKKLKEGVPYVIRLKIPENENIKFYDLIRGWIVVNSSTIDDKVLMKSDGMPTYHLANVVDDYTMKISHVIRGEEWLPSTPLHLLLYKYLDISQHTPNFAHLPLLLKPDGNGKLSKRDAEQAGFPIFPLTWHNANGEAITGFKQQGYLPEALVNFLALLGWNPKDNTELFTLDELINKFTIKNITKSGVKFDIQKAQWFNQQYIKAKPSEELVHYLQDNLKETETQYSHQELLKICDLVKERATFIQDLLEHSKFFFEKHKVYDKHKIKDKLNENTKEALATILQEITNLHNFEYETIKNTIKNCAEMHQLKIGQLMPLVRIAITSKESGPDITQIINILGKEKTIARLTESITVWNS